jgi:hypothetical protein
MSAVIFLKNGFILSMNLEYCFVASRKKILYSAYAENDDNLIYDIKYGKTEPFDVPSGKGTGSNLR